MTKRLRYTDLPDGPLVCVTLSDGTDEPDARVHQLARDEAARSGLHIGYHLGILDEPDAGIYCHAFTATQEDQ